MPSYVGRMGGFNETVARKGVDNEAEMACKAWRNCSCTVLSLALISKLAIMGKVLLLLFMEEELEKRGGIDESNGSGGQTGRRRDRYPPGDGVLWDTTRG